MSEVRDMKKHRILFVEDEPELLEVLSSSMNHYEVATARDGLEALDVHSRFCADVIVSDVRMPRLNGVELLRELVKKNDLTPFVFLSGYADALNTREAWKLGAFDFLDKPIELRDLEMVIEKAITFGKNPKKYSRPSELSASSLSLLKEQAKKMKMSPDELLHELIKKAS
jgi:DNA-binding NtrC family response regulator